MSQVPPPCPFDPDVPQGATLANFSLLEADADDMRRYWRLAVETAQHVSMLEHREQRGLGGRWFDEDGARWALMCLARLSEIEDNPDLIHRWIEWDDRFQVIAERSPKWRLKGMIRDVSETHACLSWPNRWEREVWAWAMDSDEATECPFDDRRCLLNPAFRQELRDTIEEVGGFLYRCEETQQIAFAPAEELERIWRHQAHLAEVDRNKPFGFFYDATRPNFTMRSPTKDEERMLAAIRRHDSRSKSWLAPIRRLLSRLSRLAR